MIDDLDRCSEKMVVELLDAVQNLIRDAAATATSRAPYIVVAADGEWLRTSYEKCYETFSAVVGEPGRPLGFLFMAKLFQLTVPVPSLGDQARRVYLDDLLGVEQDSPAALMRLQNEVEKVEREVRAGTSESDIVEILSNVGSATRLAVAPVAVSRLTDPSIYKLTSHELQVYWPYLEPNPRSLKRFINTYSLMRATRTLELVTVSPEALALWVIISLRWPLLAKLIASNPSSVEKLDLENDQGSILALVPDEMRDEASKPELRQLFLHVQRVLTPDTIRACRGEVSS